MIGSLKLSLYKLGTQSYPVVRKSTWTKVLNCSHSFLYGSWHWRRSLLGGLPHVWPMGNQCCLPYHVSVSKLIFFCWTLVSSECKYRYVILKRWKMAHFQEKCRQLLRDVALRRSTGALLLNPTGGTAPRPWFLPSQFKWPFAAYGSWGIESSSLRLNNTQLTDTMALWLLTGPFLLSISVFIFSFLH